MHFSVAMIRASVKPCTVNVLSLPFQHAPWPSALNLQPALQWLCHNIPSTLDRFKVFFSNTMIPVCVKHCIVNVLGILHVFQQTLWHGTLDQHFMLQWLCHNFMSTVGLKSFLLWLFKSWKVNVLCIPFQHDLWPGALDLHFTLQSLYHNVMSSLAFLHVSMHLCIPVYSTASTPLHSIATHSCPLH